MIAAVKQMNEPDNQVNAHTLRNAGRYQDAARIIRRRLQRRSAGAREDPEDVLQMGMSLMFLGRLSEAMACFGEVHVATRDRPRTHGLAVRSLRYHINVLQRLHDADPPEQAPSNAQQQLQVIEEGLRWIEAVGLGSWRAGFLYHKAQAHLSQGAPEQALDAAETSLRLARGGGDRSEYRLVDHATLVARCARAAGRLERSLDVLRDIDGYTQGQTDTVRIVLERARTLRAMTPPRVVEAVEAARRAARTARDMQAPREALFAFEELAFNAVAVGSLAEAAEALRQVYRIAEGNDTEDRRFLLRRAVSCFDEVVGALDKFTAPEATDLREQAVQQQRELRVLLDQCDRP